MTAETLANPIKNPRFAAERDSGGPARNVAATSEVLTDLSLDLAELSQTHSQPHTYLRAAIRKLAVHHELIGFATKGRCGTTSLADFTCIEALTGRQAELLKQVCDDRILDAISDDPEPVVSGPHNIVDVNVYLLTLPLGLSSSRDISAIYCFAFRPKNKADLYLRCAELRASLLQAESHLPAPNAPAKSAADPNLDRVARLAQYHNLREFSFALVNSLADRFQCQQVAFGVRKGKHVEVQAISGSVAFKANSPGVVDIQQAMEEAFDAKTPIIYDPQRPQTGQETRAVHQQWGASSRSAVCSIPIIAGNDCIAVASFQRETTTGISPTETSDWESTLRPFGPAVEMALRGQRTLRSHAVDCTRELCSAARQPKTRVGKITRAVVAAAAIFFAFGWWPYSPMTPSVIIPTNLTHTQAAFDMQLRQVFVKSGDLVKQGQLLAKFDSRNLDLEKAGLTASISQAEVDVRTALLQGDAGTASLARAQAQALDSKLQLVRQKIKQCILVAQSDGMIIQSELELKAGQVFPQGSPLLSFAPMEGFQLEIRIPESVARHIKSGQKGAFSPSARPEQTIGYTITSVSGAAEVIDAQNVLVATAVLDENQPYFRQGMEGYARTSAGWRPVAWLTLHRIYEMASANFWI